MFTVRGKGSFGNLVQRELFAIFSFVHPKFPVKVLQENAILKPYGELSEGFKEPVLKTGDGESHREFESHTLRQKPHLRLQVRFLENFSTRVWVIPICKAEFS